jgi:hypothetical protein
VENVTISSALTVNSETFRRLGGIDDNYYYEAFEVTVPMDGNYILQSKSSIDTFGCLYKENFYSNSPSLNALICDDDIGGNDQFQLNLHFNSNTRYILIITTVNLFTTGNYTLLISGLNRVNIIQINSSSIIPTTTEAPG